MNKKINFIIMVTIFMLVLFLLSNFTFAKSDINTVISGMKNVTSIENAGTSGIGGVFNAVIGVIQYAGSGIALIVVTICGIKYMLASSQEKADIKKQITPIVIGCFLLFAAVNIVGIIAETATTAGLTS